MLVTRGGVVKLLDFGIAKLIGSERPGSDEALAQAVTHLSNTVDEAHPALIEARALSAQRLKP